MKKLRKKIFAMDWATKSAARRWRRTRWRWTGSSAMGLPPRTHTKDRVYPLYDYGGRPTPPTCKGKDFLDYVFPCLQSALSHAVDLRVLQWKFSFFDVVDYVVEYLDHNNRRTHPPRGHSKSSATGFA